MHDGKVDTLLMLGGNPSYNMPADLGFREAMGKVASIHVSPRTTRPAAVRMAPQPGHALSAGGHGPGRHLICQPLILPLFDGRSLEVLAQVTGSDSGRIRLVRQPSSPSSPN